MTVSSTTSSIIYVGDGVTTEFDVPFRFLEDKDLQLSIQATDGSVTNLVLNSDYTVTGANADNGGKVHLTHPVGNQAKLSILRVVDLLQETDYRENERFPAESHERALDKLTMEVQQLQEQSDRAIKVGVFSDVEPDVLIGYVERIWESCDNIDTVANDISNVNAVGTNIADVTTVAGDLTNIDTVAGISTQVVTVAGIASDVSAVKNISEDVSTVAAIDSAVSTVAANDTNITTVATNISSVNTAASNIEAIREAPTAATNAANSATDSANSATASANSAQAAQDALDTVHGLIATPIGTIFQSVYVDESLDIARQLNGQLILSTKFTGFRSWLNTVQAAIPSLFTTETNWQAEKTNSKLGQCGKFVVDDTAGTIRLPCVVNAQGLVDLALIGGIKSESLPNITGEIGINTGSRVSGSFATMTRGISFNLNGTDVTNTEGIDFNASRSSSTYQDNAPVQQEAVQYPYYIQVATGVEETLPAIREYQVNNSDYFGKSMYSDIAPDNASWLASNGQYNARSVYPDYYDWLVEQMNKGVDGFKGTTAYQFKGNTTETEAYTPSFTTRNPIVGSAIYGGSPIQVLGHATQVNADGSVIVQDVVNNITATLVFKQELPNIAWFTDYDFSINTTDQTFRLPLLNGKEDLPSDRYDDLTLTLTTQIFTAPANGIYTVSGIGFGWVDITNKTSGIFGSCSQPRTTDGFCRYTVNAKQGDQISVFCGAIPSSYICRFIYAKGNGILYYYVGDTIQDASLINAGAVLGQLSNKADIDASNFNADGKSLLSGLGMPNNNNYISLNTSSASEAVFTAPSNGWFVINYNMTSNTSFAGLKIDGIAFVMNGYGQWNAPYCIPRLKGQSITLYYTNAAISLFRFYPAEGEE